VLCFFIGKPSQWMMNCWLSLTPSESLRQVHPTFAKDRHVQDIERNWPGKKSLFCLPPHNPRPPQQISCDPLPLNILITEIYSIYIEGSLFERRSRSGQQVRRSIRLVLWGSFGPTNPPDEFASKGRPSCLPNRGTLTMAPPIKQENLPAMEDCRLLLKNAVNVKLKGHFIISRRDGAR
jgi:hypothetical protein